MTVYGSATVDAYRTSPIHVATGRTVGWLLDLQASLRPNSPFLTWVPFDQEPRTWTYERFASLARRVASGLLARGLSAGDRVVIHMDNCPEFLLAWFGCTYVGIVPVLTNTRSSTPEFAYFADHSRARAVLTQESLAAVVDPALPSGAWVALADGLRPGTVERGQGFADLLADREAAPIQFSADTLASVQYTSGTTSRPKGVMWSHANVVWGAEMNARHQGLTDADTYLTHLPLFHTNALGYSTLGTLWAGGHVVLLPRFSSSRWWAVSAEYGCTVSSVIAYCYRALASLEAPRTHSYRRWFSGVCQEANESRYGIPTCGWWGMTETVSHPVIGALGQPNQPGTMGRPAPEYGIVVTDPEGRTVFAEEKGELRVIGTPGLSLFAGYLDDPGATADAYDELGRLKTGDLVVAHADGSVRFSDRAKDIIRVGGENVAASEIERVVTSVPAVVEAAAVGAPDDMLDEVPVVFVIADPSATLAQLRRSIEERCARDLAAFKRPRAICFVPSLPRSTLNKVAKAELRRQLADLNIDDAVGANS